MPPNHVFLGVLISAAMIACGGETTGAGDGSDHDGGVNDNPPYKPPFANCAGESTPPTPPAGSLCLVDTDDPPGAPPIAVIEHTFVTYNGIPAVHIRVVFDPRFCDNTFGTGSVGWGNRGHRFGDLTGSDHAEVTALDAQGNVTLQFRLDYLAADPSAPCGYSSLGVDGGDGQMIVGPREAILHWTSSLSQNLNDRGYCETVNSPATDEVCTPNPAAPDWDFRMVYEVWVARSAFEPNAFGSAYMSSLHASPAKTSNDTIITQPGECPCLEIDTNDCEDRPPPPGGGCTGNSDCPIEQFCYEGQCIPVVLL